MKHWSGRATRRRGLVGALVIGVAWMGSAAWGEAQAPRPQSVLELRGCCVCRTAANVRSCADGLSVDACNSECEAQSADTVSFGYDQTCAQGCAGLPTQNLR